MPDFLYPLLLFATSVAGIAAIANVLGRRAATRDGTRLVYATAVLAGALFWFGVWDQGGLLADVADDDSPYATCEVPNASSDSPATARFRVGERIVVGHGLTGGAVSVERTRQGVTIRRDAQTIVTDTQTNTARGTGSFASCSLASEDER